MPQKSGCTKRVNVNCFNVSCPMQPPNSFECGYYVSKFMKEITYGGVEVLKDFDAGKDQYTEAEIDLIREEWSSYVTAFVYTRYCISKTNVMTFCINTMDFNYIK